MRDSYALGRKAGYEQGQADGFDEGVRTMKRQLGEEVIDEEESEGY